jgi:hypothetical protein
MEQNEINGILEKSPFVFAEEELTDFLSQNALVTIDKGSLTVKSVKDLTPEDHLKSYRSARDKREPTNDELKLRVKYAYMNLYLDLLKKEMKKLKKKAYDLR